MHEGQHRHRSVPPEKDKNRNHITPEEDTFANVRCPSIQGPHRRSSPAQ
jgi:hypothetical protein